MAAAASTPAFEWLEFDVTDNPLQDPFFVDDLTVEDGRVALPTERGLGVSLTDEVLQYAVG
jgi:D-arabinonate dehydratase/D-galactarolactone cycloisomerase